MKTYLAEIIPKIKKHSEKLDNLTLLTNQHWVVIDELKKSKIVYIFRDNSELLISQNGRVEKGKWEYLGNDSLLIDRKEESYLLRHGFFDPKVLALKMDGKDEYAFLINENIYGSNMNSIESVLEFLETNYLEILPTVNKPTINSIKKIPSKVKTPVSHETQPIIKKVEDKKRSIRNLDEKEKEGFIRCVNEAEKVGFTDSLGNIVIDCQYDCAHQFKEGLALVYNIGGKNDFYGFINNENVKVVDLIYEYAEDFNEGIALVRSHGNFGFIDKKGDVIIPFQFNSAESFNNGWAKVMMGNRQYIVDRWGNKKNQN